MGQCERLEDHSGRGHFLSAVRLCNGLEEGRMFIYERMLELEKAIRTRNTRNARPRIEVCVRIKR